MPYDFGWPDALEDIHFQRSGLKTNSLPWYYYLTQQTPTYFQYIGSQLGGHGWQCEHFLPVIRILPIDTQKMVPTTQVGFATLEEAIDRTNRGEPISQDAWGRFNFKNSFFWKVLGRKVPTWATFGKNGLPTQRPGDPNRAINIYIKEAVEDWHQRWGLEARTFNGLTLNVDGHGDYGKIGRGVFDLPIPRGGIPLPELQADADKYYFGPAPPFVIFEQGQALFWKQSFAFDYAIGQLDPLDWDMSVFPPKRANGSTRKSSSQSGKFGGYGSINFPLNSPIIV